RRRIEPALLFIASVGGFTSSPRSKNCGVSSDTVNFFTTRLQSTDSRGSPSGERSGTPQALILIHFMYSAEDRTLSSYSPFCNPAQSGRWYPYSHNTSFRKA